MELKSLKEEESDFQLQRLKGNKHVMSSGLECRNQRGMGLNGEIQKEPRIERSCGQSDLDEMLERC